MMDADPVFQSGSIHTTVVLRWKMYKRPVAGCHTSDFQREQMSMGK